MSEKKPTTVQVTKTPILLAHKEEIRHNVAEFVNHCGNENAVEIMAAALNFDGKRGGKSKSSTALISDALEGRDDALLLFLNSKIKAHKDYAKEHVTLKYRVLDAVTGKEKDGKYFILKVDAKDATEREAVHYALRVYADVHNEKGNTTFAKSVREYNDGFNPSGDFVRVICGDDFSESARKTIKNALGEAVKGSFVSRCYYDALDRKNDDLRAENRRLEESVKSLSRSDKIGTFFMILGPIVTAFAFIMLKVKGIW